MIFDVENWLWKSNVGTYWHLSNSQISIISFGCVDFKAEIFLILYPFLENSTTRIAIPDVNENKVSGIYSFFDCVENQREVHSKACVRKKTYYVDKILAFFDHLPPSVDIFQLMNVEKKLTFLDYLPPSSCKHS